VAQVKAHLSCIPRCIVGLQCEAWNIPGKAGVQRIGRAGDRPDPILTPRLEEWRTGPTPVPSKYILEVSRTLDPKGETRVLTMRSRLLLPLVLGTLLPLPMQGQVHIVGRVIEDVTLHPISYADVTIRSPNGSTLARVQTDELGNFDYVARRVPAVRIHASRIGYMETSTPLLYFDDHRLLRVEVRMDTDAVLLAPLEIVAWSEVIDDAVLAGFHHRLERGLGYYITREQVEARNPNYVSDLLREVPGIQFAGGTVGNRPSVRMGRASNRNCATQIFIDGFLANRRNPLSGNPEDFRIDDVVSPASVEGIEVYRGLSTVPAEFMSPDAVCGVIAIWTRRGGPGQASPPPPSR